MSTEAASQIDRDIVVAHLNTARWMTGMIERGMSEEMAHNLASSYELAQLREQLRRTMGALDPFFRHTEISVL